jgi:GTP-binding protein
VLLTSSVTGQGLDALASLMMHQIPVHHEGEGAGRMEGGRALESGLELGGDVVLEELAEHRVFRPAAERSYSVERVGERSYRVSGKGIERLVARYDLDNEEAMAHLERRLRGIGVIAALEAEGFEAGDDVEIAGVAFELDPNL